MIASFGESRNKNYIASNVRLRRGAAHKALRIKQHNAIPSVRFLTYAGPFPRAHAPEAMPSVQFCTQAVQASVFNSGVKRGTLCRSRIT